MISVARRATSRSLTVLRNSQGHHARTGAGGSNVTVAQLGGGILQQTRGFSRTGPSRSALNVALKPNEKGDSAKQEGKNEDPLGRPEHAVISTFDLFSIGGLYSCSSP